MGVSGSCSTPAGRQQSEEVHKGASGRRHSQRGWGTASHGDVREATTVRGKEDAVDFQPSVLPFATRLRQHHIQVEAIIYIRLRWSSQYSRSAVGLLGNSCWPVKSAANRSSPPPSPMRYVAEIQLYDNLQAFRMLFYVFQAFFSF